MKAMNKYLSIGIAITLITIVLFLGLSTVGPAFSATLSALKAPTSTPTAIPGDVIPLKPITGLTSLNATVNIDVNGQINDRRAVGDLTAELATNDQDESQITISGSLLGDITAQVGGSLVGLFKPSKVDIFKVPEGTYIVINGLFPVCVKPKDTAATAVLDDLSPQTLMSMLTRSDVARGKFVGDETHGGVVLKHYVIDGDSFLEAAQKSSDPKLKAFGDALWSAEDIDLYVDAKNGYPVAFLGGFSGAYEPLKFEGDFDVQIELTGINQNTPVTLPASCNKPISP